MFLEADLTISRKEIAKILAKEFYSDTLYIYILPNDETRLYALECFFYSYINMYSTGTIVSPSKDKQAIGYIFYPDKEESKFKQLKDLVFNSITLTNMMKYISHKEFIFFIKSIYSNSSAWIYEFVNSESIHIDLIVVDSEHRNKGLAKAIIEDILKEADEKNLVTTLETQNPINVCIYEKFGFEVVKEQKYKELIQYCMIRKPNNDVSRITK